ncbi:MAG: T9SS type A sorting domain-containing protein [Sphingobacteriaceae bacterium]|nr:T9SS type A sorting domain-containing protein [Sphingobacteriaceae bacterium]
MFNINISGLNDAFVHKMGSLGVGINETKVGIEAIVYPNPAFSTLNIKTQETIEIVTVYNLLGAVVLEETNKSFSVEQLPGSL